MASKGITPGPARVGNDGHKASVIGHTRPSRLRSIRIRILLPVLVAIIGVAALGWVQISDALTVAEQADRAEILSRAASASVTLAHELGQEYKTTNEADRRGQTSATLLTAQQSRTDTVRTIYATAIAPARTAATELNPLFDRADQSLSLLASVRQTAEAHPTFQIEVFATYETMRLALIALTQAVLPQLSDAKLIEDARAVSAAAELDFLATQQLDLLERAFAVRRLSDSDLLELARLQGTEENQLKAFQRLPGGAGDRLTEIIAGPAATTAIQMRDAVLASGGDDAALTDALQSNPDNWAGAQGDVIGRVRDLEIDLAATLERDAHRLGLAARDRTLLIGGVTVLIVAITLIGSSVLAFRTSRRLRRMRYTVLTAARSELPNAISKVIQAGDADTIRSVLHDSSTRIDNMLGPGSDEIGELGSAFGAVHRQALRLAADQALLRMEIEAMFMALSRRGQTLVQRQIHLIDEFGRMEADPDALGRLFALDHLAARMRRNEENLLVLAGGEPARWVTGPVAALDVIRAAAQEIEEYKRVVVAATPPVAVAAFAAGNVIHLLAELLENATSFSPPTTPVRVVARRGPDGLTITVYDEGIGMPSDRVTEANQRLSRPSALNSTLVGTMGLLVVARLAQRHQMQIRLVSTPGSGTAATVVLPEHILDPLPPDDQLHSGRFGTAAIRPHGLTAIPAQRPTEPRPALARTAPPPRPPAAPAPSEVVLTSAGLPRRGPSSDPVPDVVGSTGVPGVNGAPHGAPGAHAFGSAPVVPGNGGFGGTRGGGGLGDALGASGLGGLDGASGIGGLGSASGVSGRAGVNGTPGVYGASGVNGAPGAPGAAPSPGTPDPETVRARLSSLAKGMAAANRRPPTRPPNPAREQDRS